MTPSSPPPLPAPIRVSISIKQLALTLLAKRWLRFGLVGGAATAVYFLFGLLFVKLLGWPLLLGNASAYVLGFVVSYSGQKKWTFASRAKVVTSLPKFALAQIVGLGVNSVVIKACAGLSVNYELSMALATLLAPVAVYLLCKLWVFKSGTPAASLKN